MVKVTKYHGLKDPVSKHIWSTSFTATPFLCSALFFLVVYERLARRVLIQTTTRQGAMSAVLDKCPLMLHSTPLGWSISWTLCHGRIHQVLRRQCEGETWGNLSQIFEVSERLVDFLRVFLESLEHPHQRISLGHCGHWRGAFSISRKGAVQNIGLWRGKNLNNVNRAPEILPNPVEESLVEAIPKVCF